MTAEDLVIADLTDENADLREANRQLVDLVADLAFENTRHRLLWELEYVSRLHGDAQIARLQRQLREQRQRERRAA